MLLGANCSVALEPLEVAPTKGYSLYVMRLHHGWTIYGPLQLGMHVKHSVILQDRSQGNGM